MRKIGGKKKPPKNWPLCDECKKLAHILIFPVKFRCGNCLKEKLPPYAGGWKYCGKCAKKLNKCALCGKDL